MADPRGQPFLWSDYDHLPHLRRRSRPRRNPVVRRRDDHVCRVRGVAARRGGSVFDSPLMCFCLSALFLMLAALALARRIGYDE
jgi:hypothetical protein